ncbi:TetR/AcrR family transcriptional regulator [Halothermothrix orenii]|uniref:Transcriptional regulator, TetR family n=1 Tax=Halothermothrix orenii (strain H 168 / OCM 544 / DSM 9562) TaxID=373903 RepID=B8D1Q7_HALOH|nr:TetR/AcrR family transcriptional regulator [Halothermothrix orenii]ACL69134.1 transcriptional regulator, TetR family [Halothermothrix orenii H 168]
MPRETFFNLSEEKRNRIINIAVEEFARYDYNSASLSRVVEKAGIAKGSMYQYFKNKKELYLYLVELASEKKFNYISDNIDFDTGKKDFFQLLKEMHLVGLKFDLTHLHYSNLILNAMRETSKKIGNLADRLIRSSDNYMKDFIKKAREKGQIRDDVDLDLISFIVNRVSIYLSEYLGMKYDFSYEEVIKEGKIRIPVSEEELEKILDEMVKVLQTGLEGRK